MDKNDGINDSGRCLNCGAELYKGNFCHICGQSVRTGRLTTKNMGVNILSGLTRINSRFLFSVKELMFRPWGVISDYIRGKRVVYVAPVQLLIVLTFISVALTSLTGSGDGSLNEIFGNFNMIGGSGAMVTVVNCVMRFILTSPTWMYILLLIPSVPVVMAAHRIMGVRKFNLAEYIVAALYLSCFIIIFGVVTMLPTEIYEYFCGRTVWLSYLWLVCLMVPLDVALYRSMASSMKSCRSKLIAVLLVNVACAVVYLTLMVVMVAIHYIAN